MLYQPQVFVNRHPRLLMFVLIVAIGIGVAFRFVALDRKVYWHDEVYTNLRSAGFTAEEVSADLFGDRIFSPPELLQYQRPKPDSTAADTIESLKSNPHHPPLYYLIARGWMKGFGGSIFASRLLPALISLISLPLIYALAWELFQSPLISLTATTLLALSPFDLLFAQTARQYSLMTALIIATSLVLLKAVRTDHCFWWGCYIFACTLGLYTHLFFSLAIASHMAWRLLIFLSEPQSSIPSRHHFSIPKFPIAILLLPILYSPWIVIIINNFSDLQSRTSWAEQSVDLLHLAKFWMLGFTSLLVDVDFGFYNVWTYVFRLPFLLLILAALFYLGEMTDRPTRLFILTAIFVPFILLVLPDLLLGGQRSAVTRYLICCFPAVQISVAFLLGTHLSTGRQSLFDGEYLWRGIFALLLTASLVSLGMSATASTWWSKNLSYFNAQIAGQINAADTPVLISDAGNGTNLGDLISLSYLLDEDVELILMDREPNLSLIPENSTLFLFRPSENLRELFEAKYGQLEPAIEARQLWKLK
ncbi:MAG: glycosyltransferase family 39 protein [Limnospira sp.]